MSDENFTPTETLVLEVLIARQRLGEHFWTFDRNKGSLKAAMSLVEKGYVFVGSGKVERTFEAGLTEVGKREFMASPYRAPMLSRLETIIEGTEWDVTSWRENWRASSKALGRLTQVLSEGESK